MKRYNIIYADPPWLYKNGNVSGGANGHYKVMAASDICAIPVSEIAERDCALFIWATFPCLPDVFKIIKAWGFTYKTVAFVWIKQNRKSDGLFWGMGYWTRSNAEICLLATRGKIKRRSAKVHQIILSHVREHSRKPDEAREKIVELMGNLPRIELFARQKTEGWDAWGNEVHSDIVLQ